ncbi:MAG: YdeI/OmpD-associated family protein [bacterium]
METKKGLPIIAFTSQEEWQQWLEEHHETSDGLWLKLAKKSSGIESVTRGEAVEVALCYGWIDSQAASFDDQYWLQRFTQRTSRSKWSKLNREMATRLMEEGKMQPAGIREVERAQEDGRWDRAYAPPSTITVPDDLQEALDDNPQAKAFFEELDSANRYAILYRIHDAKKPETRARRIKKYVKMLRNQEKIHD